MESFKLSLIVPIFLFFISCAHKEETAPVKSVFGDNVTLLPLKGYNLQPYWLSEDEFLFHSSRRERHDNFQLYRFKLNAPEARRVTFHDGDTESAAYYSSGSKLYYSSSTDEIKELSTLVERYQEHKSSQPKPKKLHPGLTLFPTEVYASDLDGGQIQRLTRNKEFDGALHFNHETKRLLFSSLVGKFLQLFSMKPDGSDVRQLTTTKRHSVSLHYSLDQRRYGWVEVSDDGKTSVVRMANYRFSLQNNLKLPRGYYTSPKVLSDDLGILLSAQIEGISDGFDIFLFREEEGCLAPVVQAPGDQLSPDLSVDQKKLLFVHQQNDESQIAILDFLAPTGPCLSP